MEAIWSSFLRLAQKSYEYISISSIRLQVGLINSCRTNVGRLSTQLDDAGSLSSQTLIGYVTHQYSRATHSALSYIAHIAFNKAYTPLSIISFILNKNNLVKRTERPHLSETPSVDHSFTSPVCSKSDSLFSLSNF